MNHHHRKKLLQSCDAKNLSFTVDKELLCSVWLLITIDQFAFAYKLKPSLYKYMLKTDIMQ